MPLNWDTRLEREREVQVVSAQIIRDKRTAFMKYMIAGRNFVFNDAPDTAYTNGASITFTDGLWKSPDLHDHLYGIFLHELLHITLFHPWRSEGKSHGLWNCACDIVVNEIIIDDMGIQMPKGVLYMPEFHHWSAEGIYNEFLARKERKEYVPEVCDDMEGPVGPPPEDPIKKGQSDDPTTLTDISDLLKEAMKPSTDWRSLLYDFFNEYTKADYKWVPPRRDMLAHGIYLPSMGVERTGNVVIAMDTSGSVSMDELKQFLAEVQGILGIEDIMGSILLTTTEVYHAFDFPPFPTDREILEKYGSGGTNFIPTFDFIEKNYPDMNVLVYLTDGFGDYPVAEPSYPVLWALTPDHETPPWGMTIVLDV